MIQGTETTSENREKVAQVLEALEEEVRDGAWCHIRVPRVGVEGGGQATVEVVAEVEMTESVHDALRASWPQE